MKLLHHLIIGLLVALYIPLHAEESEPDIAISNQTFLVYRRYYFIARLDRTIKLLDKFSQDKKLLPSPLRTRQVIDELMYTLQMQQFNHALVKDSVTSMHQVRSLKPLFMVWDAFKSYKSLKDDLFIEDFSKEIFIITRTIAQHLHDDEIKSMPMDLNVVCRCDAISRLTEYIEQYIQGADIHLLPPERKNDISDLALNIHTDEVAFRYYALRRLYEAAQYMLHMSPESQKALHEAVSSVANRHEVHKALRQRTFAQLWDDCQQYKFIDDSTFLHAFAVRLSLMLHVHHHQDTFADTSTPTRKLNYAQLMQIYQQINKMPIEDILCGIDFLVTNALTVANNYQNSELSLTEWIKEYWWAPPVMIATVIFQCVKFYYKKYHSR